MFGDKRKPTTADMAEALDRREEDARARDRLERDRLEHERADAAQEQPRPTEPGMDRPGPLFGEDELGGYRTRWSAIQTGFVDEPRRAVEEADTLVAELMKRLTDSFADERRQLESRWERSDRASTEDLRLAMRRYRSFFERLLSI